MKKLLLPIIAGIASLALIACGDNEEGQEQNEEPTQEEAAAQEQMEEMQAKMEEQQVAEDEIVAVVNGEEVTGEQYNALLTPSQTQFQSMGQDPTTEEAAEQIKTMTLDNLVGQVLLLQKANESGINVSEEEIEEERSAIAEQYGGAEAFDELLAQAEMDEEMLNTQLENQVKYNKYIEETLPIEEVTDEDIQASYDELTVQYEESDQEIPALEDVQEDIRSQLERERSQELLVQHVEELKEAAEIEFLI
ncbi:SurA N-terminal domain-containing protein [Jeotgalibacillus soli]|uniref:Peptidylprolyl isomerase n=1 Tax=Jeotgalibacillus soli TaxID=889306 RepID=A0A0C2RIJ9_9BACL|nr:SurA N-terminal domain-containing protein [Jeotgalibacillus soli]KIL49980.1 peptidylprolyl isomerase [Jeotgalibacillus soli]